jgi:hypothetical protein
MNHLIKSPTSKASKWLTVISIEWTVFMFFNYLAHRLVFNNPFLNSGLFWGNIIMTPVIPFFAVIAIFLNARNKGKWWRITFAIGLLLTFATVAMPSFTHGPPYNNYVLLPCPLFIFLIVQTVANGRKDCVIHYLTNFCTLIGFFFIIDYLNKVVAFVD